MFELGGTTVTWGVIVLAVCVVAAAAWTLRRRPLVIVVPAVLIAGVHAVAYWTAYLDAARVASVRERAIDLSTAAFLAGAGAIDAVLAAIGRVIGRLLETLAAVPMPGTAVSILAFGSFLLVAATVSALACVALAWIVRWNEGAQPGGVLAALGVVFGASGLLLTWLPVRVAELTAIHTLSIAAAIVVGVVVALPLAVTGGSPAVRERVRAYR